MKQTVISIRTSTEDQNPRLQLNDCEGLADKLGLKDYEIIEDKQSAWKDHVRREGFEKIKVGIKRREVQHLICWDLDRLFRNRKKLIEFFEFCKIYGCKIHSFRQDWLESLNQIPEPFNEIMHSMMLQIMGWIAEDESQRKSDRIKKAVRRKTGKPTKSYKGNKWGRKSISTQKKNKISELRKQGMSVRAIAQKLDLSVGVVHKTIVL